MKHDSVPVAYCLSQNVQIESALEDESINVTVAAISMFHEGKISQVKQETSKDVTLVKLAKVIQTGWPDQQAGIDLDLHAFWIHSSQCHCGWCCDEWYKNCNPMVLTR